MSAPASARTKKSRSVWPWAVAVAIVLGTAWYGTSHGWFQTAEVAPVVGAKVVRGPLRISVVESGHLKAADFVSLRSEIEGQSTILFLVAEGKHVEEGELLAELDATSLIDKRVTQEISLRNAEAAYVKSTQNYQIQVKQNESDVEQARQALEFAKQDKDKYEKGDRVLSEEKAKETITLADEEHKRAQEKLNWSEKLAERGFLTNTELEGDQLSLTSSAIKLEQAQREKRILLDYTIPRQIATLEADLRESGRELERVELQAKARIVDFEADRDTNKAKLQLEQEKLAKLVKQIGKARLIAPKAGMVVYAKQDEGGRMGSSQPIQEGTQVRERQEIVTIPTAGGMLATVSLHESVLKQVRVDQRCEIKVDALPGSLFHGVVKFVSLLPDQNSWWANPNARLYTTTIEIADGNGEMRPGMSCSIEILVEDIADALYVPVQSVFRHEGKNICFVDRGAAIDPVAVEVGRFNDRWVQILKGLEEGQTVLLSPPPGFDLRSAPQGEDAATPDNASGPSQLPGARPGADSPGGPDATAGAPALDGERAGRERGAGRPEGGSADGRRWPGAGGDGSGRQRGSGRRGDGAASEREGGLSRDGDAKPADGAAATKELPKKLEGAGDALPPKGSDPQK